MSISILGAGAFGTSLAIALGQQNPVTLWTRAAAHARNMQAARENVKRLPGALFPEALRVTESLAQACEANVILLAVPMQQLADFVQNHRDVLQGKTLVACCKGVDQRHQLGPVETISDALKDADTAVLTGPSFAADIARGLPTALTLACAQADLGRTLQQRLSTPVLRLYRTRDVVGAELGGAFKNVIALACGVVIGAGLGESARAALMTRGFAEMVRLGLEKGAQMETLAGLSGFGDLALTCTSGQSRNYARGFALGQGSDFDAQVTVEGAATARALRIYAQDRGLDLPITTMVARLLDDEIDVETAMVQLLSRPLKEENPC